MSINKFTVLRSILRRSWLRWPARSEALLAARRSYKGDNKRQKFEYKCAICKKWFKATEVQVDHIISAGTLLSSEHIGPFVMRLFCEAKDLRVLCKPCHVIRSAKERALTKKK